ncbi:MAG: ABC transporter permease, partial [Terriglobales bacterium]
MEAFTFGAAGTGLGIAGGIVAAQGALNAIAQTFEHFYFKEPIETVLINPEVIMIAFLVGVAVTVAASLIPAVEAAGVAPAEATRHASFELKASERAGGMAKVGTLLLMCAGFSAIQPAFNGFPFFGYAAALFTILGAALITPLILKLVLPVVAQILEGIFGAEGRLAARSLLGTLGRTSVALASLTIGIAMMVSLAIMIGSFRKTVMVWVDQTLKADLWIQTSARYGGNKNARMSPATVESIRTTPGVAAVDAFVEHSIDYQGDRTNLGAGDLDVVGKYGHLLFTSGEPCATVCERVGGRDAIVSEAFAIRKNVKQGDTIQLPTPEGLLEFRIQGVYYDYASDLGYIVISHPVYRRLYQDDTASSCAVYVDPAANLDSVRADILCRIGNESNLRVRTTRELRSEALKVFDRTFAITYALHTIAIAVAVLS